MAERGYLPDVNLWIALASNRHVHHLVARRWLDSTADPIFYCRITQMGLLRLLTNRRVMDEDVLMPPDALSVYKEFLSDARIYFSEEPEGVENR